MGLNVPKTGVLSIQVFCRRGLVLVPSPITRVLPGLVAVPGWAGELWGCWCLVGPAP